MSSEPRTFRFVLPGPLRDLARNRDVVTISGRGETVGHALALLWKECPAVRDRVVNEREELRPHVNVFVDGESIRFAEHFDTPVRDGSEIVILPAVSGG